jgi:hypothetical protein
VPVVRRAALRVAVAGGVLVLVLGAGWNGSHSEGQIGWKMEMPLLERKGGGESGRCLPCTR